MHKLVPNLMTSCRELAFKVFEAYMLHTERGGQTVAVAADVGHKSGEILQACKLSKHVVHGVVDKKLSCQWYVATCVIADHCTALISL